MEKKPEFTTIDEYIALFPPEVQARLGAIRAAIHAEAGAATEKISYRMPTFYLNGNLVHFAAYPKHIGFYPAPTGIEAFKADLAAYAQGRGSVQFPHSTPLPLALIRRIVRYRVQENLAKPKRR